MCCCVVLASLFAVPFRSAQSHATVALFPQNTATLAVFLVRFRLTDIPPHSYRLLPCCCHVLSAFGLLIGSAIACHPLSLPRPVGAFPGELCHTFPPDLVERVLHQCQLCAKLMARQTLSHRVGRPVGAAPVKMCHTTPPDKMCHAA